MGGGRGLGGAVRLKVLCAESSGRGAAEQARGREDLCHRIGAQYHLPGVHELYQLLEATTADACQHKHNNAKQVVAIRVGKSLLIYQNETLCLCYVWKGKKVLTVSKGKESNLFITIIY